MIETSNKGSSILPNKNHNLQNNSLMTGTNQITKKVKVKRDQVGKNINYILKEYEENKLLLIIFYFIW
jgi:hypothetical protein